MPIYRDIYDGPPRWYTATRTRKRYVMIHATANTAGAEAEASYAKRRPSRVSSHYYVDDDSIVQSLDTDYRAWHAGSRVGNDRAIAYELTARRMSVGRTWWLEHIDWPLMVVAIRRDCEHHGITPQTLSISEIRAGHKSGIITHDQARQAWGGTSHTDPGPNFPMQHLVSQLEGDELSWDQRLTVPGWFAENFPGNFEEGEATARLFQTAGYGYSRLTYDQTRKLLAGQTAILARLDGKDEGATREVIREELDRHWDRLLPLLDGVPEAVAAELGDRDSQVVREAVERVLSRIRVTTEEPGGT